MRSGRNKERFSDELLCDLIEHFSRIDLSKRDVHNDVLGDAYEYLIKKFADATNRRPASSTRRAPSCG